MAQIIAVVSLGIVLALSTLAWKNWDAPMPVDGAGGPRSIVVEDVMRKVDVKALPNQQMQDRTTVFSDQYDQ